MITKTEAKSICDALSKEEIWEMYDINNVNHLPVFEELFSRCEEVEVGPPSPPITKPKK